MDQKLSVGYVVRSVSGILIAFFLPHLGLIPLPFGYTIAVLLIIWLLLKKDRQNFSDIGFSFSRFEPRAVWLGALVAVALFCFLNYCLFPLLSKIIYLPKANLNDFNGIRHSPAAYVFILAMGWVVGGVYEEIVFHGFIYTRLKKLISGKRALYVAFLCTNIIFALYHVQLGISGMLNAFLAGCVYQGFMIKCKGNMWYAVLCHGFFDTIGLTFIYLGYW
jgi:membrane protease YdiL (CAAX protease family)